MADLINEWLVKATEDSDLQRELHTLQIEEDKAEDCFCKELEFGTGGLRGIIGAGINRMNIYTVRKATQGLSSYLCEIYQSPSVVIAYDSRHKSALFAQNAACVLAGNGIKVHLFPKLTPTPVLSYAVRKLECSAGICITASHNPAQYNGYKVYGEDGGQITDSAAEEIQRRISPIDPFDNVRMFDYDEAILQEMICFIDESLAESYILYTSGLRNHRETCDNLRVVYTPLNGTGKEYVIEMLKALQVGEFKLVHEQAEPDGNFPTCPRPNPEEKDALAKGLALCEKEKPDLFFATDPDCDRVGVAVLHNGEYQTLSGNETGLLLLDYLAGRQVESDDGQKRRIAIKTIVTSPMAEKIATKYGVELRNTLTGFKYIGEMITLLDRSGEKERFLFGFEESCGYLYGTDVRDKDAVVAIMLICEMASAYKKHGLTLADVMKRLYMEHGWYLNRLKTWELHGRDGAAKIRNIMSGLRANPPEFIMGQPVTRWVDYTDNATGSVPELPLADVLEIALVHSTVIVRPSGTEPKLKAYLSSSGDSRQSAEQELIMLEAELEKLLQL